MNIKPGAWNACRKRPIIVHVREQLEGEQHVSTREGITPILPTDLIMRGVEGEEYPIGRELFEKTYELVHDEQSGNVGTNDYDDTHARVEPNVKVDPWEMIVRTALKHRDFGPAYTGFDLLREILIWVDTRDKRDIDKTEKKLDVALNGLRFVRDVNAMDYEYVRMAHSTLANIEALDNE